MKRDDGSVVRSPSFGLYLSSFEAKKLHALRIIC